MYVKVCINNLLDEKYLNEINKVIKQMYPKIFYKTNINDDILNVKSNRHLRRLLPIIYKKMKKYSIYIKLSLSLEELHALSIYKKIINTQMCYNFKPIFNGNINILLFHSNFNIHYQQSHNFYIEFSSVIKLPDFEEPVKRLYNAENINYNRDKIYTITNTITNTNTIRPNQLKRDNCYKKECDDSLEHRSDNCYNSNNHIDMNCGGIYSYKFIYAYHSMYYIKNKQIELNTIKYHTLFNYLSYKYHSLINKNISKKQDEISLPIILQNQSIEISDHLCRKAQNKKHFYVKTVLPLNYILINCLHDNILYLDKKQRLKIIKIICILNKYNLHPFVINKILIR